MHHCCAPSVRCTQSPAAASASVSVLVLVLVSVLGDVDKSTRASPADNGASSLIIYPHALKLFPRRKEESERGKQEGCSVLFCARKL